LFVLIFYMNKRLSQSYNKHKKGCVYYMLEKLKSRKDALILSNIAGMVSGFLLGAAAVFAVMQCMKRKKSIRCRAKKAFRTIENRMQV